MDSFVVSEIVKGFLWTPVHPRTSRRYWWRPSRTSREGRLCRAVARNRLSLTSRLLTVGYPSGLLLLATDQTMASLLLSNYQVPVVDVALSLTGAELEMDQSLVEFYTTWLADHTQ